METAKHIIIVPLKAIQNMAFYNQEEDRMIIKFENKKRETSINWFFVRYMTQISSNNKLLLESSDQYGIYQHLQFAIIITCTYMPVCQAPIPGNCHVTQFVDPIAALCTIEHSLQYWLSTKNSRDLYKYTWHKTAVTTTRYWKPTLHPPSALVNSNAPVSTQG